MPRLHRFLGIAALLSSGCGLQYEPSPYVPCTSSADPLGFEEVSSIGFSGAEVVAAAEARFAEVQVSWDKGATPASDTFFFTFGPPLSTAEGSQSGLNGDCAERTWVSVEIPVEVTTASGEVEASGVIEVWGVDEGGLQVFVPYNERQLEATLSGSYLAAAQAEWPGLQEAFVGLHVAHWTRGEGPLTQSIGIFADYYDGTTSTSGTVYGCAHEGTTPVDCLTFAN